jgi:hypothetical protein
VWNIDPSYQDKSGAYSLIPAYLGEIFHSPFGYDCVLFNSLSGFRPRAENPPGDAGKGASGPAGPVSARTDSDLRSGLGNRES